MLSFLDDQRFIAPYFSQVLILDSGGLFSHSSGLVRFAEKKAETLFRLICCERKTLFWLKKQAEKYGL